jgi:hypothetical protein
MGIDAGTMLDNPWSFGQCEHGWGADRISTERRHFTVPPATAHSFVLARQPGTPDLFTATVSFPETDASKSNITGSLLGPEQPLRVAQLSYVMGAEGTGPFANTPQMLQHPSVAFQKEEGVAPAGGVERSVSGAWRSVLLAWRIDAGGIVCRRVGVRQSI